MAGRRCQTTVAVLACILTIQHVAAEYKYIGCFQDRMAPQDRDLGEMVALDEAKMSPAFCEDVCGRRHQFQYFGLQYGSECWCGGSYGRHGPTDSEAKCDKTCTGSSADKCGGHLTSSVYETTTQYTAAPPSRDGRPLLGLVMIVKNESHTLPKTLLTIKPWIDVYYILDTGSTDGTQEAIRRTLGRDKGEVWEEPFIDYGRSRNRALDIAANTQNLGGPPIFSLMLSADESLWNGEGLRRFCEEHRNKLGPKEEAYYVTMDVEWKFDSARLSRTDSGWRYKGRVHEYLAHPRGLGAPTQRVPRTVIQFRATDDGRRHANEYVILRILQEEVAEKPRDTRARFYLARTYNVVRNHSAALVEFENRVALGGWREEVYESLYAIAWQKDRLGRPWHEIQQAFMDAHQHSPERAEPLYAIASHYFNLKQHSLAFLFASFAATLPYPTKATLWVQASVYEWQCPMIVGMCGIEIGKVREGAVGLLRALMKHPTDPRMLNQIHRYRAALGAEFDAIECEVDPVRCKEKQEARGPVDAAAAAGATPVVEHADSSHRPSDHVGLLAAGGHHDDGDTAHTAPANLTLLYLVIALLLATNVVLLVAVKKGRGSPATCFQSGMTLARGLTANEKQV